MNIAHGWDTNFLFFNFYKLIAILEIVGSEKIRSYKNGNNVWCFDDYTADYNRPCRF